MCVLRNVFTEHIGASQLGTEVLYSMVGQSLSEQYFYPPSLDSEKDTFRTKCHECVLRFDLSEHLTHQIVM